MSNRDAWTVQLHVMITVEVICRWNCDNPTFRSKVMMILKEGKYCNPKIVFIQFIISERWNVLWQFSNIVYGRTVTWLLISGLHVFVRQIKPNLQTFYWEVFWYPKIRSIDLLYFVSTVTRPVDVGMRSFKHVNYITRSD
jgi:hypothetical protein